MTDDDEFASFIEELVRIDEARKRGEEEEEKYSDFEWTLDLALAFEARYPGRTFPRGPETASYLNWVTEVMVSDDFNTAVQLEEGRDYLIFLAEENDLNDMAECEDHWQWLDWVAANATGKVARRARKAMAAVRAELAAEEEAERRLEQARTTTVFSGPFEGCTLDNLAGTPDGRKHLEHLADHWEGTVGQAAKLVREDVRTAELGAEEAAKRLRRAREFIVPIGK
jgi:hypothetical protein